MTKIKSPFNWVGNKYKYVDTINELIKDKSYNNVYELFMGTGNILINLECEAKSFIGSDVNRLIPSVYNTIKENTYTVQDIEDVLNENNRFSAKDDYYTFRDNWNEKYFNNTYDKKFSVETALLLKMCSNSMVRFNKNTGKFNQGFRGLGNSKEFFADSMKQLVLDGLNNLHKKFNENEYIFKEMSFEQYIDNGQNDLLILDPPYLLESEMYNLSFTETLDNMILELLNNTKNDFIYFNYIKRGDLEHEKLKKLVQDNNFEVIVINNKTNSGQGRKNFSLEIVEVLVTNIKN